MSCNQSYRYIKSELSKLEFEEHIKECEICAERVSKINQTMDLLDMEIEVPSGLVEKVLKRKSKFLLPQMPAVDYSKYLQLAAVVAAGIFLGVYLGRNANSEYFMSKKGKKDKALSELREFHHMNESNSIYKF